MSSQNEQIKELVTSRTATLPARLPWQDEETFAESQKTDAELMYGEGLPGKRTFFFRSPGVWLQNGKQNVHCVGKIKLTCDEHHQVMAILTTRVEQDLKNLLGQDDVEHFAGRYSAGTIMAMRPGNGALY